MKEMARHKKNPTVGTKNTAYASEIMIDQADALSFAIDEEVSRLWRSIPMADPVHVRRSP